MSASHFKQLYGPWQPGHEMYELHHQHNDHVRRMRWLQRMSQPEDDGVDRYRDGTKVARKARKP